MATEWSGDRWFVDGERVNAGDAMELQGVVLEYDGEETRRDGEWIAVRIESRDEGRELDAWIRMDGVACCSRGIAGFVDGEPFARYASRWPRE